MEEGGVISGNEERNESRKMQKHKQKCNGKVTIHGLGLPGLPGAPRAPGAPETLKLQVDRRSEMVWFAKGNEIHISDFCIANTMDIKYQL